MEPSLELDSLNCQHPGHSGSQIIGFCIDEKCKETNKFACSECIFDVHSLHRLVKIKELNNLIQTKYKVYKQNLEEEKKIIEVYKASELESIEKIEKLKKDVINEIENKTNNFIQELKNKYNELINFNAKDFANLKDYEEFFIGNAAPIQKPDHSKLSEICFNIYKEGNKSSGGTPSEGANTEKPSKKQKEQKEKKEQKNNFILENFKKEFDNYIKDQFSSIQKYINDNYLIMPNNFFNSKGFEWCEQTYSGYDFFYELSNNKTKGVKTLSNGTMTILRAKEMLENNHLYKIKFKIGLRNNGDFDVGIGTEKVGDSCWLRTKESLCISNTGVLNLDLNMDNSITLRDKDIVYLEISTEEGNKYFEGHINGKLICKLDFYLDNVYIMAAIRNTNNYIEVLEYKDSPL